MLDIFLRSGTPSHDGCLAEQELDSTKSPFGPLPPPPPRACVNMLQLVLLPYFYIVIFASNLLIFSLKMSVSGPAKAILGVERDKW